MSLACAPVVVMTPIPPLSGALWWLAHIANSCIASPRGWHTRCRLIHAIVHESQVLFVSDCLP